MKKDLMALESMEIQPLDDEMLNEITGGCGGGMSCSFRACSVAFGDVCPEHAGAFGGAGSGQGQGQPNGG